MEYLNGISNSSNVNDSKAKLFIWLSFFSIAMGVLEAIVVIYMRKLYYPEGFNFPLKEIEPAIGLAEFIREAATIVMLFSVGFITGRNRNDRFLYFIFCFGIWDLVYYLFLKLFLDWPSSVFDWDILFLIPFPWVGPVLAPCIVSITMIGVAVLFFANDIKLSKRNVGLLLTGCLVIIYTFCVDYIHLISNSNSRGWVPGSDRSLFSEINNYIPQHYNWLLFFIGEGFILAAVLLSFLHQRSKSGVT